ncbi:MAG: MTH1187 family thiamine-binding protein [Gammaproteobacteria bacterium]|nr:MTH1187 family thiamine-binding protein [Gammaproteobacteria bacterium]
MQVMIDLCVVPVGVGTSVSAEIAECQRIIRAAGLKAQLHPYGTVIEGEWDEVFAVVKRCHERLHEQGIARILSLLKIGTRTDRTQTMEDKVASVERRLRD